MKLQTWLMKLQTWLRYAAIVIIFALLALSIERYVRFLKTWEFLPTDVVYMAAALFIVFLEYWTAAKWTSHAAGEKPGILMYVAAIAVFIIFIVWSTYNIYDIFKFPFKTPSRTEYLLDIWVNKAVIVGVLIASQAGMNPPLKSDTE